MKDVEAIILKFVFQFIGKAERLRTFLTVDPNSAGTYFRRNNEASILKSKCIADNKSAAIGKEQQEFVSVLWIGKASFLDLLLGIDKDPQCQITLLHA